MNARIVLSFVAAFFFGIVLGQNHTPAEVLGAALRGVLSLVSDTQVAISYLWEASLEAWRFVLAAVSYVVAILLGPAVIVQAIASIVQARTAIDQNRRDQVRHEWEKADRNATSKPPGQSTEEK